MGYQVCATTEEWQQFPAQFANSKHKANRELHRFLVDDILPEVLPQLEVPLALVLAKARCCSDLITPVALLWRGKDPEPRTCTPTERTGAAAKAVISDPV